MTEYPAISFHFQVEWGGTKLGFSEVSGLGMETEVIEYREGSSPLYSTKKLPGIKKYSNVQLKRGIAKGDNEFFIWWNSIKLTTIDRRDIIISLLDEEHKPFFVWKLRNSFPVKIIYSDLKATGNEIAIESLEIAHEGIEVINM